MPLPGDTAVWPPIDPTVSTALADWSAWYSGSPDQLGERYLNRATAAAHNRPSQYRGGVVGRFARWFWGAPTAVGAKRTKLHVPLAGDIARTSSELLFAEPPKITVEHAGTQARIEMMLAEGLRSTLLEGGELAAALGGVYLRLVWDDEISDRPWISAVHADAALPVFAHGRLREVMFWSVLEQDGQRVVRHLELHKRGTITHAVYEGTDDHLGKRVDLKAFEETQPYADDGGVIETGAPNHLTAAYIPNMRPARMWRSIPDAAYWGQSDFAGIEGLFDALDETYSSLMRDIRIAKGRITVPNAYLQSAGPGAGAVFDEDAEVYVGLDMLLGKDGAQALTATQFNIRVTEHLDAARALITQAVRQAGYSAATFGETGDGAAVTATEIHARERRSIATRARKELYAGPGIADIVEAQIAVEAGPLFNAHGLEVSRPQVQFEDSVQEDPLTLANTVETLRRAQAASTETLVRMTHPDWDEQRVAAETKLVVQENGLGELADPADTGAEG